MYSYEIFYICMINIPWIKLYISMCITFQCLLSVILLKVIKCKIPSEIIIFSKDYHLNKGNLKLTNRCDK
ncbi:hypothetical protein T07_14438 [Trichinella nelsoni]|uniref:Uncharacterized protein n=1 Tax=Trichinella nelsoni TaxID=6336 RepID=A0A0V0S236_9BILA|nr:hypothetical protein T07_14438 [Trichinella nelsoni]